jgi:hypothetical protein
MKEGGIKERKGRGGIGNLVNGRVLLGRKKLVCIKNNIC